MELNPLGLPNIFDVSRWSHKEVELYKREVAQHRVERQYTCKVQHLHREEQRLQRMRDSGKKRLQRKIDSEEQRLQRKRETLRASDSWLKVAGRFRQFEEDVLADNTLTERLQSVLRLAVHQTQARKTLWDDLMSDEKGVEHVKWRFRHGHRSIEDLRAQYEEVLRMNREWAQNTGAMF
ncbi:MAG: hypothetical protein Q9202_004796 [Teloschistes flavicans]